jgi:hypothetical protein
MPITLIPKTHERESDMPSDMLRISCASATGDKTATCDIQLFGGHSKKFFNTISL